LNRCLESDWFLLPYELKLQAAHARTLQAAGILSTTELEAILRALSQIEAGHGAGLPPVTDAEDIHTWIEAELTERAGDAGRKIHTARSRNDQVATLLKLYVVGCGERLLADSKQLAEICCRRAVDWSDVAMPLMTHQQFAAPGSAGAWVLRFACASERVCAQAASAARRWREECPLGSGAVVGSSIPLNRGIQARELGFDRPSVSALDSTSTRDECVEFLAMAAGAAIHLASLATDVIIFSQTPLGWVKFPADFGTGSSMMPNKMNPDAMELLRGESTAVMGAHGQALMLLKGLPSGYNRDLQCIKPLVREAAENLHGLFELAAAFLEKLEFDVERLAASMKLGGISATLRMEELVKQGKPLREAHHAVAAEVQAGKLDAKGTPADWIASYQTAGSASPNEVRRAAKEILGRVAMFKSSTPRKEPSN